MVPDVIRDPAQRELLNWIHDAAYRLRHGLALSVSPVEDKVQQEYCDKIIQYSSILLWEQNLKEWNDKN